MTDKHPSQPHQDLADIFRIVAERGEKQSAAGSLWHYLGDIATVEGRSSRMLITDAGRVTESTLPRSTSIAYEEGMDAGKLHDLADRLRGGPKP